MTGLKLLEIEYDGICGTIKEYTGNHNVINYLANIKKGIDNKDYDIVKYSLEELINWYDKNYSKISNNSYVYHLDAHQKKQRTIKGNLRYFNS